MNSLKNPYVREKLYGLILIGVCVGALSWLSLTQKPSITVGDSGYGSSINDLAGAVSAISTTPCTLIVSKGATCPISASLTIPTNINLRVEQGGVISISDGYTLTCPVPEAGDYQIFQDNTSITCDLPPVMSQTNTPPTTCYTAPGNRWLVGTSPTGAWSGQANKIADCNGINAYNSGITFIVNGSVTSGNFTAGEIVKQNVTGVMAILLEAPLTSGLCPMYITSGSGASPVGIISTDKDELDAWVGQSSGAVFTPSQPNGGGSTAAPWNVGVNSDTNYVYSGTTSAQSSGNYPTFYVTGSVTSGTFVPYEMVTQTTTGVKGWLLGCPYGSSGNLPMYISSGSNTVSSAASIAGANSGYTWVGNKSGAVFTPTAAPVGCWTYYSPSSGDTCWNIATQSWYKYTTSWAAVGGKVHFYSSSTANVATNLSPTLKTAWWGVVNDGGCNGSGSFTGTDNTVALQEAVSALMYLGNGELKAQAGDGNWSANCPTNMIYANWVNVASQSFNMASGHPHPIINLNGSVIHRLVDDNYALFGGYGGPGTPLIKNGRIWGAINSATWVIPCPTQPSAVTLNYGGSNYSASSVASAAAIQPYNSAGHQYQYYWANGLLYVGSYNWGDYSPDNSSCPMYPVYATVSGTPTQMTGWSTYRSGTGIQYGIGYPNGGGGEVDHIDVCNCLIGIAGQASEGFVVSDYNGSNNYSSLICAGDVCNASGIILRRLTITNNGEGDAVYLYYCLYDTIFADWLQFELTRGNAFHFVNCTNITVQGLGSEEVLQLDPPLATHTAAYIIDNCQTIKFLNGTLGMGGACNAGWYFANSTQNVVFDTCNASQGSAPYLYASDGTCSNVKFTNTWFHGSYCSAYDGNNFVLFDDNCTFDYNNSPMVFPTRFVKTIEDNGMGIELSKDVPCSCVLATPTVSNCNVGVLYNKGPLGNTCNVLNITGSSWYYHGTSEFLAPPSGTYYLVLSGDLMTDTTQTVELEWPGGPAATFNLIGGGDWTHFCVWSGPITNPAAAGLWIIPSSSGAGGQSSSGNIYKANISARAFTSFTQAMQFFGKQGYGPSTYKTQSTDGNYPVVGQNPFPTPVTYTEASGSSNFYNFIGAVDGKLLTVNLTDNSTTISQAGTTFSNLYTLASGTYTDEHSASSFNFFAAQPAVGDAVYFGSTRGSFSSIQIDLGSVGNDTTATVVWQYYNGSWTTLSTSAASNLFFNGGSTGVKNINFVPPADAQFTTVNGVWAYWVRAYVTVAGSNGTTAPAETSQTCRISSIRVPSSIAGPSAGGMSTATFSALHGCWFQQGATQSY